MIGALPATLLLSLVTFVSASTRRSYPIPNHHLPRNYVALGDSYSSGVGSGNFLNQSRDGLDIKCVRQDGSYPSQLVSILPFGDRHHSFDFRSCAGDKLDNIDGQVAKYSALRRRYDLITLTIGGNDFSFGDIAEACVYQPRSANISNPQAICDAAFNQGFAALANSSTFDKFAQKIELVKSTLLAPRGKLFVTGYGKFFAKPVEGDACDHLSFFPIPQLAALNMTVSSRQKANNLTEQVNAGIQKVLKHQNDDAVTFFDFDKSFEGKRFCEPANAKDPIGSNNDNVFFNDLATVLKTPGVADVANQTPGLKVDISNVLQQVSVFHPKTQAYKPLVAQFAYKILSDAAHAHGVVIGPTKYCRKHKGLYTRDKSCDGFEVPEHCAAIVRKKEDPVVVCQNGDSFSPKHID